MQSLSVVIANRDSQFASHLAASLNPYFRNVSVVRSLDEVRNAIPKQRAQLAILDLELASVGEVEQIARMSFKQKHADGQGQIVDAEAFVIELLASVRHFYDGRSLDFGKLDRLAYRHYLEQVGEERRRTV